MEHIKLLLIEDNPGDARLIKEMLAESKNISFDLEWKESLAEGLKSIDEESFDIILLDLMLPDSKGFGTFERLKLKAPGIPIVVNSGIGDEALAIRAVREGAQDYLIKGKADSNLLSRAIRYAIERTRSEEMLKKYAAELEEANHLKDIFTDIMRPELLKLEQAELDMNKIFGGVVEYYKPDLARKNIKLEYLVNDEKPARANPLIEIVFSNLLSSAIKRSPEGSKIEVNILDEDGHYRIYVKDSGYGIKDEEKEAIYRIPKGRQE